MVVYIIQCRHDKSEVYTDPKWEDCSTIYDDQIALRTFDYLCRIGIENEYQLIKRTYTDEIISNRAYIEYLKLKYDKESRLISKESKP